MCMLYLRDLERGRLRAVAFSSSFQHCSPPLLAGLRVGSLAGARRQSDDARAASHLLPAPGAGSKLSSRRTV